jgi:hypothetical protein
MARPLKRTIELRQRAEIYLTPAERQLAQAKADEAGLTLSSFVRESLLSRRIAQAPTVSAQRWSELARTASNLNQLTRHLNNGTANGVPPELITRLLDEVQALRRELLGGAQ